MFTAYRDGQEVAERDFMDDLIKDLRDARMTHLQGISFLSDSNHTFQMDKADLAKLNRQLEEWADDAAWDDADCYTRNGEDAMTASKDWLMEGV